MSRPLPPAKIEYDQRFIFRPVEPSDIPQIDKALHTSLSELRQFMGWSHYLMSPDQFLERVLQQHAYYFQGVDYELGMFDKSSGEFLLYVGLHPVNRHNPLCFEIGFWTSTKKSGKGLATLATQVMIATIFEYFGGDRVEITCNIKNLASQRVIEKCGFQPEGELRNYFSLPSQEMLDQGMTDERSVFIYSLIPEDLKALNWYPSVVERMQVFPLLESP